jgi:hypothetical protein
MPSPLVQPKYSKIVDLYLLPDHLVLRVAFVWSQAERYHRVKGFAKFLELFFSKQDTRDLTASPALDGDDEADVVRLFHVFEVSEKSLVEHSVFTPFCQS